MEEDGHSVAVLFCYVDLLNCLSMQTARFSPGFDEFEKLAQRGNLVPVHCEVLADLETPVSAFLKLRPESVAAGSASDAFLLESVEGGETLARYSFLGVTARATLKTQGREVWLREGDAEQHFQLPDGRDPLHVIQEWMARFQFVPTPGLPRFCGGAVGYLGYDLVRFFERLPDAPPDDRDIPDCYLLLTDTVLIFDTVRHSIKVVNNAFIEGDRRAAYDEACRKIEAALVCLERESAHAAMLPVSATLEELTPRSNMTREQFEAAVEKGREYIHAGDCVQVVPSQRFAVPLHAPPFTVYRALRHISPAPYMFFLSLGEVQLIGASPEILVTEDNGQVRTRPLAGTRRRGKTPAEDTSLEAELLADPKERAEHVMLVDLGRNDLGRVCEYGSVKVSDFMSVERYSHVMHIASDVTGRLRPDKTQFDVIRAAFPAGTLSGAPKVRAMQIIDELEPTRRGPYGGAIGYFSFSGNLDSCITLRTLVVKDGVAYVQAGCGVVADSVPATEYQETHDKARAALRAVALAEQAMPRPAPQAPPAAPAAVAAAVAKAPARGMEAAQARPAGNGAGPSPARIFCDGACSGNPGPGGWGCIIEQDGRRRELSGGRTRTTNNQMELQALIEGLRAVAPGTRVSVVTDSEYLAKGITSWLKGWIKNGWLSASKQPVKNREQWEELHTLLQARPHRVEWVRGHSGHSENERCDELARAAIRGAVRA